MGINGVAVQALELKIPPVALVIIIAALMWALMLVFPNERLALPGSSIAGFVFVAFGVGIALLGVLEFRSAGTTVDPRVPEQSDSLVVKGIYRVSRNPMYVGFLLALCGWAIFLRSIPALFLLPAFVLYINRFQIAPEERYMHEKFGDAFHLYTREVRRWV